MVLIRHQALVHTDADAVLCTESSSGSAGTRQDALEVIVIRPAAARRLSFSTAQQVLRLLLAAKPVVSYAEKPMVTASVILVGHRPVS